MTDLKFCVHLRSSPKGAYVYLIPLYDYENDPDIVNDNRKLSSYRVSQGNTDLTTEQPEKVFKAVFVLQEQKDTIDMDVRNKGNSSFGVNFK